MPQAPSPLPVELLHETSSAGRWTKVGGTYVLRTDPMLERAAQLSAKAQKRYLLTAMGQVVRLIGIKQRETLRSTGSLDPEQMLPEQRKSLAWVAGLGFALDSKVTPDAIALKGVRLEYISGKTTTTGVPGVRFLLPTQSGKPLSVGETSLS